MACTVISPVKGFAVMGARRNRVTAGLCVAPLRSAWPNGNLGLPTPEVPNPSAKVHKPARRYTKGTSKAEALIGIVWRK